MNHTKDDAAVMASCGSKLAADCLEMAVQIERLTAIREPMQKRIDFLELEVERLREQRRKECTEFARIAGVKDSRDTRIVLRDADPATAIFQSAAAAVLDAWEEGSVHEGWPDELRAVLEQLRIAAKLPPDPTDDPHGEADRAYERKGDR